MRTGFRIVDRLIAKMDAFYAFPHRISKTSMTCFVPSEQPSMVLITYPQMHLLHNPRHQAPCFQTAFGVNVSYLQIAQGPLQDLIRRIPLFPSPTRRPTHYMNNNKQPNHNPIPSNRYGSTSTIGPSYSFRAHRT